MIKKLSALNLKDFMNCVKKLILIRAKKFPEGIIQTCIAGESGVIKSLRKFFKDETQIPNDDIYISGYWKIGLIEDEHQAQKRLEK